jgi:hypothetical protein
MAQDIPLTEKQLFWLEHIQACSKSGLTMKAYAQANDLSVSAFYAWKKTLRGKSVIENPHSDELPVFRKAVVSDNSFGRARVLLPSGLVLEFDVGVDPLWVGAMLRALP